MFFTPVLFARMSGDTRAPVAEAIPATVLPSQLHEMERPSTQTLKALTNLQKLNKRDNSKASTTLRFVHHSDETFDLSGAKADGQKDENYVAIA